MQTLRDLKISDDKFELTAPFKSNNSIFLQSAANVDPYIFSIKFGTKNALRTVIISEKKEKVSRKHLNFRI